MNINDLADRASAFPQPENGAAPIDPTPALPLPGEGAESLPRQQPEEDAKGLLSFEVRFGGRDESYIDKLESGATSSSPWQGGGWEGVNCQSSEGDEVPASGSASPYSHPKTIFNAFGKKPLRQSLRKNLTTPERQLWQHLRNKQLGVKFRRQHGIGPYIADFYCPECALVIELDGESHFNSEAFEYDQRREAFMQSAGITTLRFTNSEVVENVEGVVQIIFDAIRKIINEHPCQT